MFRNLEWRRRPEASQGQANSTFQLPEALNPTELPWSIRPESSTPALLNLCEYGKICHHLAVCHGLAPPANKSIGYLDLSCGSKHLIYLKPQKSATAPRSAIADMRTLQQPLVQSRGDNIDDELPLKHRLVLAQKLATAVLHFHATSWLPKVWDSQRILLSDDASSKNSEVSCAPEPYAMARIDKPSSYVRPLSATQAKWLYAIDCY